MNSNAVLEAESKLVYAAERTRNARADMDKKREKMRSVIVKHLVNQSAPIMDLADAAQVERNYIDRLKARSGAAPLRGDKTRGVVVHRVTYTERSRAKAVEQVSAAAADYHCSQETYDRDLKARDALISEVYRDRLMGPTEIARAVGIDRNSVMRITRAAGVPRVRQAAAS